MKDTNHPSAPDRKLTDKTPRTQSEGFVGAESCANADEAELGASNIVPLHEVITEIGGPPDECGVALAIYGEELDPDEITRLLGVRPTVSHRRGDRPRPQSKHPFRLGAWFLECRGNAPVRPDELTKTIFDPERWKPIQDRFKIQLRYGLHISGWNKEFDLPRELVARIAAIGATMNFDLYAYGEDEEPPCSHDRPSHEPAS